MYFQIFSAAIPCFRSCVHSVFVSEQQDLTTALERLKMTRFDFKKVVFTKLISRGTIISALKHFSPKYECFCPELVLGRDNERPGDKSFIFRQESLESLAHHRVSPMLPKFWPSWCLASIRAIILRSDLHKLALGTQFNRGRATIESWDILCDL